MKGVKFFSLFSLFIAHAYSRHLRNIDNSVMLLQAFFPVGAVDNSQ